MFAQSGIAITECSSVLINWNGGIYFLVIHCVIYVNDSLCWLICFNLCIHLQYAHFHFRLCGNNLSEINSAIVGKCELINSTTLIASWHRNLLLTSLKTSGLTCICLYLYRALHKSPACVIISNKNQKTC